MGDNSQYKPGAGILITGFRGYGKTDLAFYICFIALMQSKKIRVITNVLTKETKYIKVVKNDLELFEYLIKWRSYLIIVMLDEGAVIASSKRSMSTIALYLDSFFYLIRKFNSMLIYIVQREMSALASVRELTDYHYHKIEKSQAYLEFREYRFHLKNIIQSPIHFESRAIASFEIRLNFDKIFKELSGISIDEAYKVLGKIIKNPTKYYNSDYLDSINK